MTYAATTMTPRDVAFDLAGYNVPHPRPFLCDLIVTAADMSNTIEHVSNVQYVRWLDRAAELHADSLGYTRPAMLDKGIMWFVARHEIDYMAEVWLKDELVIATWVRDFRRVKSWREYIIIRPKDQTVVCSARTLWVLVDLATRRPRRISAAMLEQFDPLESVA